MQVKKFLVFLIFLAHLAESVRIRKTRNRKAKRQDLQANRTEEVISPPSDAIMTVETAAQETTTQTILQREIQSLLETLKTSARNSSSEKPVARKNAIERPPRTAEFVEPKHIDLECKFGNASD
jgi:hypothetical protein